LDDHLEAPPVRAPTTTIRTVAGTAATLIVLTMTATVVLAKGEAAGLIRLAAPIPRDAEPGSTLTVDFTATMTDAQGGASPLRGSPVVLRLTGPDGTSTEALAAERGTPGSYRVTIEVPAGGITSAIFGLQGSAIYADGTTSLQDVPFDVDGLLFTTTAHPAAAPPATTAPPPTSTDAPLPIAGILGVVFGAIGLTLAVIGRRRTLRSA
jgi:hypothetical protein